MGIEARLTGLCTSNGFVFVRTSLLKVAKFWAKTTLETIWDFCKCRGWDRYTLLDVAISFLFGTLGFPSNEA
jgi:hypothetical protein